jgi:hypothetical protein
VKNQELLISKECVNKENASKSAFILTVDKYNAQFYCYKNFHNVVCINCVLASERKFLTEKMVIVIHEMVVVWKNGTIPTCAWKDWGKQ